MKSTAPSPSPRRRLVLAALLIVALALSLTGLVISSSRDPIVGTWSNAVDHRFITFHPDGTCTQPTVFGGYEEGTWRAIPGPYYARNPSAPVPLHQIIDGPYRIGADYVSAHQLTPEHFQQALAQNAIHLTPASARVRLYECSFPPIGLVSNKLSAPSPALYDTPLALEDEELNMGGVIYHRYQPGNWLTRAWDWFRGLLPP